MGTRDERRVAAKALAQAAPGEGAEMTFEPDDLPLCVSWWPEAAEVISRHRRNSHAKENGVLAAKQRKLALDYYRKNKDAINAKRRATRPSRSKKATAVRGCGVSGTPGLPASASRA